MPGNPKPRKPSPRQPRPQLSDLLRQTHVLCAMNTDGKLAWAYCACGEVVMHEIEQGLISVSLFKLSEKFQAHRDGD